MTVLMYKNKAMKDLTVAPFVAVNPAWWTEDSGDSLALAWESRTGLCSKSKSRISWNC